MTENSFRKNIRSGKYWIAGADLAASILFAFAAIYMKNYWLFLPVIVLIVAAVMTIVFLKKLEKKFEKLN
jgi:hypothetical protein